MSYLRRAVVSLAAAAALSATSLGAPAHATPSDPSNIYQAQAASMCGAENTGLRSDVPVIGKRNVVEKEHTDAVAMCIRNGQMHMFTKVDWQGAAHSFEPADEQFLHVNDALKVQVPADGFDFTGAGGKDAWMVPQTQNFDGIWAGWNTEEIEYGDVDGDSVTMKLVQNKSSAPAGAKLEIFQMNFSGQAMRQFSLTDPAHSTYRQDANAHVHSNWVFTHPGVYRLVFGASVKIKGEESYAEQEYVFVVGDINAYKAELEAIDNPPAPEEPAPEDPAPSTPAPGEPDPEQPDPSQPAPENPGDPNDPQPGDPGEDGEPGDDADKVVVTASADKTKYRVGETAKLTAEVTNGDDDSDAPDFLLTATADQDSYMAGQDARIEANYSQHPDSMSSGSGQPLKVAGSLHWEMKLAGEDDWYEFEDGKAKISAQQIIIPSVGTEFDGAQVRAVHESEAHKLRVESEPVTLSVKPAEDEDKAAENAQAGSGSSNGSGSNGTGSGGGFAGGSAPVMCVPMDRPGAGNGSGGQSAGAGGSQGGQSGAGSDGSAPRDDQAPAGEKVRVTDGHFDFGARLNGSTVTAEVKDDRFAPPIWRTPGDAVFVIGDAAKNAIPAEYSFLGTPGSEIYMIGQTQQADVPWLGWNTQDEQLANNASKVVMKLESYDGPGRINVFVGGGGLGGGSIKQVFQNIGDSYEIPLRTHEHGNWVFSAPGVYTATVSFTVTLQDGSTSQASGVLNFEVGQQAKGGAGSVVPVDANGNPVAVNAAGAADSAPEAAATPAATPTEGAQEAAGTSAPAETQPAAPVSSNSQAASYDNCVQGSLPRTGEGGIAAGITAGVLLLVGGAAAVIFTRRRRA